MMAQKRNPSARKTFETNKEFPMKHTNKALLCTCLITASQLACADGEFFTGNALYQRIQSATPSDNTVALGYVMGIHDATTGILVCSPNVTAGQVRDIVKKSLENNPENRDQLASTLVIGALSAVWPCKAKPSGSRL
jgi:hypothetical protein